MAHLTTRQQNGLLTVILTGRWELAQFDRLRDLLNGLQIPSATDKVLFDATQTGRFDVSAAWLVTQHARHLQEGGKQVDYSGFPREYFSYFDADEESRPRKGRPQAKSVVVSLGKSIMQSGEVLYRGISFFGHSVSGLMRALIFPASLKLKAVFHHIFATGISAIPIVMLLACLISIVITYQGGGQLRDLGAVIYTVDLVAVSVLREMGVLLTAIIVAGRSGSAFAAEIGLMRTNQEIDALEVMGADAFAILVVPRMLALIIALPLLAVIADLVALSAAAVISYITLDITISQFVARIKTDIELHTYLAGIVKAPFFAIVIAFVGCWQGMLVSGSSESLGQHTTKAVVQSIFLVLMLDALFSILFYKMGF